MLKNIIKPCCGSFIPPSDKDVLCIELSLCGNQSPFYRDDKTENLVMRYNHCAF